jgi:hypothetical protein
MCWHKWTKWEKYIINWLRQGTTTIIAVETRQKRQCIKCGKTQDELVYYS